MRITIKLICEIVVNPNLNDNLLCPQQCMKTLFIISMWCRSVVAVNAWVLWNQLDSGCLKMFLWFLSWKIIILNVICYIIAVESDFPVLTDLEL